MKERNDILWNEYKKNSRSCNPDNAELVTEQMLTIVNTVYTEPICSTLLDYLDV